MTLLPRLSALLLVASTLPFVSGCSTSFNPADDSSTAAQVPISLQGSAFGGRQPIVGAHIFVFAAATTGYGATMAGAVGTASNSLLTSSTPNATLDSTSGSQTINDYFLTTDANGAFTISGTYCTAGTQVYLYSTGGVATTGTPANPQSSLMAILGTCPAGGTFSGSLSFIYMNELTTVAAGYAIAGFAYDAVHVGSSGTTLAKTGIANAFANANQLANILSPTQTARATTPLGTGTVPQALLNSLANMLVACVNSANSSATTSTPCNTIRAYATSDGAAGTLIAAGAANSGFSANAPRETATAIINLAHHPYDTNVTTLFNQGAPVSNQVFTPILASAPADFTVQLLFTGTNFSAAFSNTNVPFPHSVAVDASGNLWAVGINGFINKLTPLGIATNYSVGYVTPAGLAIDTSAQPLIFIPNQISSTSARLISFATSNSSPSMFTPGFGPKPSLADIAIDGSGAIWVADEIYDNTVTDPTTGAYVGGLYKLNASGANLVTNHTTTVSPSGVAIQPGLTGNVWLADVGSVDVFTNSGATRSPHYFDVSYSPLSNAIDSNGSVWHGEFQGDTKVTSRVLKFTTAGVVTSSTPSTAYNMALTSTAIDGGNNIWVVGNNHAISGTATVLQELNNSGAPQGSATGFIVLNQGATTAIPASVAIDGSGNVWYNSTADAYIREVIGSAFPATTPLSYAVANTLLGQRP